MKKALVIRLGAYGDMIIITPVLKKLKELGYYVILNTNKRGQEVMLNNPNVDEIILHVEPEDVNDLQKIWDKLKEDIKPDKFINFSESIECNVAMHPFNPEYIYSKKERAIRCDKNYYDVTEAWAGLEGCDKQPEMYFTEEEILKAKSHLDESKFNILWVLSGSGQQKVYPWTEYVMGELLLKHEDIRIITTGDMKCQLLETLQDKDIIHIAGEVTMRESCALTSVVDLVVGPDTGVLHASGCFSTPKIGLLGHTNKNNITKYFDNDYSIEANVACSPCFRLIYDHNIQCPVDVITKAAWCMSNGIKPEDLFEKIIEVKNKHGRVNVGTSRESVTAGK